MKGILRYFFQGLIYIVPLTVTAYVIYESFTFIDGLIPINIPGLGLILVLLFITVVGVVAQHLISEKLLKLFEGYILKAPLISVIYSAVKDLMQAFVGKKKSFSKPVLVKFQENSEVRRMGFITNNNFENLDHSCDLITVYIPHSYNISGNMFLVPARYIEPLSSNSGDVMKYAVSGGVTDIRDLRVIRDAKVDLEPGIENQDLSPNR